MVEEKRLRVTIGTDPKVRVPDGPTLTVPVPEK